MGAEGLVHLNGMQPSEALKRAAAITGDVLASLMRTDVWDIADGGQYGFRTRSRRLDDSQWLGAQPPLMQRRGAMEPFSQVLPISGYAVWWNRVPNADEVRPSLPGRITLGTGTNTPTRPA